MRVRERILVAAGILTLATVVLVFWLRSPGTSQNSAMLLDGQYSIAIDTQQVFSAEDGKDWPSDIDFDLKASIRSLHPAGERQVIVLSVDRVESIRYKVVGFDFLSSPEQVDAAFRDARAVAYIDSSGEVGEVGISSSSSVIFESIAHIIFAQLQIPGFRQGSKAWTRTQETSFGRARMSFSRTVPDVILRTTDAYERLTSLQATALRQTVKGTATFTFSSSGLDSMSFEEHGSFGAASQIDVSLMNATSGAIRRISDLGGSLANIDLKRFDRVQKLGDVSRPKDENAVLRKIVGSLAVDEIVADIMMLRSGQSMPDHKEWLWKTVSLLKLDPSACDAIAKAFLDPSTDTRGRQLVIDLLASAGHKHAQSVLIQLLESDLMRNSDLRGDLYQHFIMLERPSEEMLQYAKTRYASSTSDSAAEAIVLGALAGKEYKSGDRKAAVQAAQQIDVRLRSAQSVPSRVSGLNALGNAGMPEFASTVLRESKSTESEVRTSAATAMRFMKTDETRDALIFMLGDAAAPVRTAAANALRNDTLTAQMVSRLEEELSSGRIPESSYGAVLTMLTSQKDLSSVLPAIAAIGRLARPGSQPALRAGFIVGNMSGGP